MKITNKCLITCLLLVSVTSAQADNWNFLAAVSQHEGQSNVVTSTAGGDDFSFGGGNSIKFGALVTQDDSPWQTTLDLAFQLNDVDSSPVTSNSFKSTVISTLVSYHYGPVYIGLGPTLHLSNIYTSSASGVTSKTRLDKRMAGKIAIGFDIKRKLRLEIAHEKIKYTANSGVGLFTFSNGSVVNKVNADNTSASLIYIF